MFPSLRHEKWRRWSFGRYKDRKTERPKLNTTKANHIPWFSNAGTDIHMTAKNTSNARKMESLIDFASVAPEKTPSNCRPQKPTNGYITIQIKLSIAISRTVEILVNHPTTLSPKTIMRKASEAAVTNPHTADKFTDLLNSDRFFPPIALPDKILEALANPPIK